MTELTGDAGSGLPRLEKSITCTRLQAVRDSLTLSEYLPGVQRAMKPVPQSQLRNMIVWAIVVAGSWILFSHLSAIVVTITAILFILLGHGTGLRKSIRKKVTRQYLANVVDPERELTSCLRIDECGLTSACDGITSILSWESIEHAVEIGEGIIVVARHDNGSFLKRDEFGEDFPVWREAVAAYLDRYGRVPLERGPDAPAA